MEASMFDIPEKGKDVVIAYLQDRFEEKKESHPKSEKKIGVLDSLMSKKLSDEQEINAA
jgi:hypothetical protein